MEKKSELIDIANNPSEYLDTMKKTLEDRLDEIVLTKEEKKDIIRDKTLQTIRDKGLSLFGGVGDVISTMLNWNEDVNNEMTEAKKVALMTQYFNKVDNIQAATANITEFLVSPQGNTIYNKILRILDDYPPDIELVKHLSRALKYIAEEGNFEKLFERHKYALSQIEKLTPQSLTIIADYADWPDFELSYRTMKHGKVDSNWYEKFVISYSQRKGVFGLEKERRLMHSVIELERNGFMEVYAKDERLSKCGLTSIAEELLPYIEPPECVF